MIRSFVAWVLLFVLLAFLCGLIASGPLNDFAYTRVLAPLSVAEGQNARRALEEQFGTPLPDSVTEVYRANRGDEAYWLRVNLARDDVGNLFRGSAFITCRFPLQDRYRPIFEFARELTDGEKSRVPWWTPTDATISNYVGGECTGSDYRIFRIFIDQTSSTRWTLYMEIMQL